jgi:hypothetical protein
MRRRGLDSAPHVRPAVELLEAPFLRLSGDLYGRTSEVGCTLPSGTEMKFDSMEALRTACRKMPRGPAMAGIEPAVKSQAAADRPLLAIAG